jgi:HD-GYP domain-containing protein (c-di-GMP phosphodiesterase class II)
MVRTAHSDLNDDGAPGRLAAVLGALSLATDLGVGQPMETALRITVIATRTGAALGLEGPALADVFYTAMLRYLGCSGYAHEQAAVTAGDDLSLLPVLELTDFARPSEVARTVMRKLAAGRPLRERAGAVARFLSDPRGYAKLARAHCDQAVALARQLDVGPAVATALGQMYERHDGRGAPHGLAGDAIALPARLLVLAQTVEAFARAGGEDAACEVVRRRRGAQLHPEAADALLSEAKPILRTLAAASVWDAFLGCEPAPARLLRPGGVDAIATAFGQYVDLKSPFTLGHSTGTARLAAAAAVEARLADPDARTLRLAALLHDLGRVSVPNGIWDKPGPLNAAERERVRLHAYHGERVLRQAAALAPIAALVARHHERMDGSGYHGGLAAAALDASSRLLAACDVYQALTEDRPWRPAFAADAAARELRHEAETGRLDRDAVAAVLAAAGHRPARIRGAWPDGLSDREVEVLRLLARGLSNKEIGRALHISPVTAKNHIAHIYEKTGVATRSAAALYAVTAGLVETV